MKSLADEAPHEIATALDDRDMLRQLVADTRARAPKPEASAWFRDRAITIGELALRISGPVQPVGLTRRQTELLHFICRYIAEHGYPPSYAEMQVAMGMNSKSGVYRAVQCLVERGALRRLRRRARSLAVAEIAVTENPAA